jgi:hypothetical protein
MPRSSVRVSSRSLTTTSFNDLALPVWARRWGMRDLCGETKRLHEDFLRFSHGSGARLLTRTDPSLASETLAAVLAVNFVCAFGACGLARRLRVRGVVSPASRTQVTAPALAETRAVCQRCIVEIKTQTTAMRGR